MTGDIVFYNHPDDRSLYERFHWELSSGRCMGFNDQRKFGRIVYIENLDRYLQEIKLGPDALVITEHEFLQELIGRTTNVKALLMDQNILSGIGNLYADEICYQARVHPASVISAIPKRKQKLLYRKMMYILKYACAHDAYYGVYPDNWFWKWRQKGIKNPNGPGSVSTAKIAGRTPYFVKGWQKLYS